MKQTVLLGLMLLLTYTVAFAQPTVTFECFSCQELSNKDCQSCDGTFEKKYFKGLLVSTPQGKYEIDLPFSVIRRGSSFRLTDYEGDVVTFARRNTEFRSIDDLLAEINACNCQGGSGGGSTITDFDYDGSSATIVTTIGSFSADIDAETVETTTSITVDGTTYPAGTGIETLLGALNAAIGGQSLSQNALNGLTMLNDSTVVLGGTLLEETILDFDENEFLFQNVPQDVSAPSFLLGLNGGDVVSLYDPSAFTGNLYTVDGTLAGVRKISSNGNPLETAATGFAQTDNILIIFNDETILGNGGAISLQRNGVSEGSITWLNGLVQFLTGSGYVGENVTGSIAMVNTTGGGKVELDNTGSLFLETAAADTTFEAGDGSNSTVFPNFAPPVPSFWLHHIDGSGSYVAQSAIGGQGLSQNAANGLNMRNDSTVVLGGNLDEFTEITLSGDTLRFTGTSTASIINDASVSFSSFGAPGVAALAAINQEARMISYNFTGDSATVNARRDHVLISASDTSDPNTVDHYIVVHKDSLLLYALEHMHIKTPKVEAGGGTTGDYLKLIDGVTGEVEFETPEAGWLANIYTTDGSIAAATQREVNIDNTSNITFNLAAQPATINKGHRMVTSSSADDQFTDFETYVTPDDSLRVRVFDHQFSITSSSSLTLGGETEGLFLDGGVNDLISIPDVQQTNTDSVTSILARRTVQGGFAGDSPPGELVQIPLTDIGGQQSAWMNFENYTSTLSPLNGSAEISSASTLSATFNSTSDFSWTDIASGDAQELTWNGDDNSVIEFTVTLYTQKNSPTSDEAQNIDLYVYVNGSKANAQGQRRWTDVTEGYNAYHITYVDTDADNGDTYKLFWDWSGGLNTDHQLISDGTWIAKKLN